MHDRMESLARVAGGAGLLLIALALPAHADEDDPLASPLVREAAAQQQRSPLPPRERAHGATRPAGEAPSEPAPPEQAPPEEPLPNEPIEDALTPFLVAVTAPAREDAVRALMKQPQLKEPAAALRVVGALWHAGGPHAAKALRTLASDPDPRVKEAVLRAVGVVALRCEAGTRGERELRRALTHPDKAVRRAAYEAVGSVGSGDDVASLILGLVSEEADIRSLALRALRTLTGERLTAEATRWAYWWERSRTDLERQLEQALETLSGGEVDELVEAQAWDVVERRVWLLPAQAAELASVWLGTLDERQRARGYRLAACVRVAALAEDVLDAERHDAGGASAELVARAKRALGLLPPGA